MNINRFIIATLVKGEASEYHNKLVRLISETHHLEAIQSPSHITLKDSFYCEKPIEVEEVLERVLKHIKLRGKIFLNNISHFRKDIFYIDANFDENGREIYLQIYNVLKKINCLQWDEFDTTDRKFHVTITNKASEKNYAAIEKTLSEYNPKFELDFDNISILQKDNGTGKWFIYKSFYI